MKSMCFKVCSQISELVRNVSPGQTGMCGGVRGVSAGGIVSSCFCLLYKLYTLKVTKKQVQFTSSLTWTRYLDIFKIWYIFAYHH